MRIAATGAGTASNLTVTGADIAGKADTELMADNRITLQVAEQNHSKQSDNKSRGWNAGVAISYGQSGFAFGVTTGGNYGKGYGNGDDTTWRNSHIGNADSQTILQSGGNTILKGAQVAGNRIALDAQSLNIESLQDTATYQGKQQNISGQITVGYGASGSASYSQSKINADHASVNEQSGLFAGDSGYQINIKEHTDLKGGLITSTAKAEAEGKNRFQTTSLTHSDIQNHSNYDGESFGLGGGFSMGGGEGKQEVGGQKLMQMGSNTTVTNPDGSTTTRGDFGVSKSIGFGFDSDSQSSTTRSGINTANIVITDAAQQKALSGQTAAETVAAVKTNVTTDDAEANSGRLNNSFDKDKVQQELDVQREVTQQFDETRQGVKREIYNVVDTKRQKAEEIRRNNYIGDKNGYNTKESLILEAEANKWEKAAFYTDLTLGALYGWGNPDAVKYVGTAVAADPAHRAATAPEQIWLVKCAQDSLYCSNTSYDGKQARPTDGDRVEIGDKRQIFDIQELEPGKSTGVLTISNPGILNPLNDALKNAVKQNTWQTAADGIITVYNPPTSNPVSEGVYALYDKVNDLIGGRLPLTNAEKANLKLYEYAKQNNYQIDLSNHSRGGMTASVALQNANRNGLTEIPIRESRFYGTATNVQDYANQLAGKNQYSYSVKNPDDTETVYSSNVFSAVHYTDFVGRSPLLFLRSKYTVGGNEPTGGVENKWFLYSHSSYFREIPTDYFIDNNGNYIDEKWPGSN